MAGAGEEFYEATKYIPGRATDYGPLDAAPLAEVQLPRPAMTSGLAETLALRRSRREFSGEEIKLDELSFLLWASDGVSHKGGQAHFRTAPSAGARHPIDTYVIVLRVGGVEKGIYRYRVDGHALELVRRGDYEEAAVKAAAGQEWIRGSAAVFIWIAEFARTTSRYKERGYRYVFLDAGHICQNLYLACEAAGLGMTAIAAFADDEANALAGADGRERGVAYMAAVGRAAGR